MINYTTYTGSGLITAMVLHEQKILELMTEQVHEEAKQLEAVGIYLTGEKQASIAMNSYRGLGTIILAETLDRKIVGFIFTGAQEDNLVAGLYVKPEHRRQGVARGLYSRLRELKGSHLWARVNYQNKAAVRFFEGLNFTSVTTEMRCRD